jgi:hypothetical protein
MFSESVQFAPYDALPQVALKILGDDGLRARAESKALELNFRHQFDLRPIQAALKLTLGSFRIKK